MKTDLRDKMHAAVREAAFSLATSRGCSRWDALREMVVTYRENLELSADTSMESYWQDMLEVAQAELAEIVA